ncbi:hypothetical protein BZA70DRAFT_270809 [Myxozyma melibiosi]|uniref:Uncharacterized protein n=1 Tax=Myxozyma melibiosi TaxID=54550 RepID=A0ABR1FDW7_9ASCO
MSVLPSIYDIPALPISDAELFLRTFVRLFAAAALPPANYPDVLLPSPHPPPSPSSPPPTSSSQLPSLSSFDKSRIIAAYTSPQPSLDLPPLPPPPLPPPPPPPPPPRSSSTINSPPSPILDPATALAELDSISRSLHDPRLPFIIAPSDHLAQRSSSLTAPNKRVPPTVNEIHFRTVNFSDHRRASVPQIPVDYFSSSISSASASPGSVLSPSRRRSSGNTSSSSSIASCDVDEIVADSTIASSFIITEPSSSAFPRYPSANSMASTSAPFIYSSGRRINDLSVSSEATTTSSFSSISPSTHNPSFLQSSSTSSSLKKFPQKLKQRRFFSSSLSATSPPSFSSSSSSHTNRTRSDQLSPISSKSEPTDQPSSSTSRLTPAPSEIPYSSRSPSDSQQHSHSAKPHAAPYGSKPDSPYYVLTNMGVRLVTPGKDGNTPSSSDAPVESPPASPSLSATNRLSVSSSGKKLSTSSVSTTSSSAGKSRKGSAVSSSSAKSWIFGKKNRSSRSS